MTARFIPLSADQMSPEQRQVSERALAGPLKRLSPPLSLLLRNPRICDAMITLAEEVRFRIPIPERLKQLAILLIARHWTLQYPWSMHYGQAVDAGMAPEVLAQIAKGLKPTGLDADEASIYDFCKSVLGGKVVSDTTIEALRGQYGDAGIAELIGLMGYHLIVGLTLMADSYPAAADSIVPPLEPL